MGIFKTLESLQTATKIYNIVMAIFNICAGICLSIYIPLVLIADSDTSTTRNTGDEFPVLFFVAIFVIMFLFILATILFHIFAALIVKKEKKWVFIVQMISFFFGLGSLITMVPAIILIIGWLDEKYRGIYWNG